MSKLVNADEVKAFIKREINPYGKPFEGSAYDFGLKVVDYIDNKSDIHEETEEYKESVIRELMEGKWVECSRVQRALGLSFGVCFSLFDFSRTAEWWSVVGRTEEERARNGQKIETAFRMKGVE